MYSKFASTAYQNSEASVTWCGIRLEDNQEFGQFLRETVSDRLNDSEGANDFQDHLRGLALTGMGTDALEAVLRSESFEERGWAAGEALAEAILMKAHGVVFPWNMERDKRNSFASLQGADIIGFQPINEGFQFVLGEVKTSSEASSPPGVMSGRSRDMGGQLVTLATDLSRIYTLLKWLLARVKGKEYEDAFNASCLRYFNSGNRAVSLFGILIRDTKVNEHDLSARGKKLGSLIYLPTACTLCALYLPWSVDMLVSKIREEGES